MLKFLQRADQYVVDICIVTPWKELEDVCKIADLLAKRTIPYPQN